MSDTIAAIATSTVRSGIGIVRMSGPEAIRIADSVFAGRKSLNTAASHTIHYGSVKNGDDVVDEVLVSVFRAPHSYTTEDVIEINCHGGPYVLQQVLSIVIAKGARLAEPGEFTKRAFLGGRIDLAQAEAVMGLISSENEYARKSSIDMLSGSLSREIGQMRDEILSFTAHIEAALDDPEHISIDEVTDDLPKRLSELLNRIEKLIRDSGNGRVLAEGIPTVIIGKPNVGKSSLWNRLVGRDLAIVTDIPGTTRDVLQETVHIGDITLRLSDTAGIRETDDVVEGIGVERALTTIDNASLVLAVIDGSEPIDENDIRILNTVGDDRLIVLINKSDLESVVKAEDILERTERNPRILDISALDGSGMDELCDAIRQMYVSDEITVYESTVTTSERHIGLLKAAYESLKLALEGLESKVSEDLLTVDLMDAFRSLGLIIGSEVSDDLADRIFSEFCMGK